MRSFKFENLKIKGMNRTQRIKPTKTVEESKVKTKEKFFFL